uniref:Phosphoglucomutase (alpha-D-glucose-1,6-bisphosphate-dependent) n=1 Tax=Acrobeloides nanus TaxID=290746 RepID=A0A914C422_9BILA
MVFEESLQKLVDNYLAWDKNEKFRKQIEDLVAKNDEAELRARMFGKLTFGTAGVRARMEAGFNRLNDLTVIQLTHGMAKHMLAQFPRESNGVAIGFDGRYNSRRFADLAANVFIRNGIKVYIFSDVVPTPVLSYATALLKCDAGLMVTASHNPKEDNGYKAYWSNGAQIIGPHDVEIVKIAQAEPEPRPEYWDISNLRSSPLLLSADTVDDQYFAEETQFCHFKHLNEKTPLKFTYSAFHGVGYKYAYKMLREYGIPDANIVNVKEQAEPNPDFPTVPFPNPEEGLKVLKLSIKTADENGSTIILANDPDADRLQMAEKQKSGEWRVFTGNEMGTLLSWWVWKNWRAVNPNADLSKVYMLNSTVSCNIVKTMAKAEGFKNDVTLTGFKWMGNLADKLRQEGNLVILAWEESIGFMPGHSLDKDGVIAAGMFAELAVWLNHEGLTLNEQLFKIYFQYGFHLTKTSYWMVSNPQITKQLFADHRKDLKYPAQIGGQKVRFIRDLTTGYDNEQVGNKAVLPLSTSSEMITFTLENGSIATLRASGTEPKIKYYIELKTDPGKEEKDLQSVLDELGELEKNVVETLLQPQRYGLQPRA